MHAFISRTASVKPTKSAADDAVTNVQLHHVVQTGDWSHVLIVEAVAGMQFQSRRDRGDRRGLQGVDLAVAIGPLASVGIAPV